MVIDHEMVTFTPDDAADLLDRNIENNRRIRNSYIQQLTEEMTEGRFNSENGQTITVDPDGRLINGQHRLTAQINAGVTMRWLIVTVDDGDEAYKTIDNGSRRQAADYFTDEKSSRLFAAIAMFGHIIVNTSTHLSSAITNNETGRYTDKRRPPRLDVIEFGQSHREQVAKATDTGRRMYQAVGGCGKESVFGKFAFFIEFIGEDEWLNSFIEDFCDMAPDNKTVTALKTMVMRRYSSEKVEKPDDKWLFGTLLDGYSHFRKFDGVKRLARQSQSISAYDQKLSDARRAQR